MSATNVNACGTVKFFDQAKGFGIITTKSGDVFIHATKTNGKQPELVTGAEVHIDFMTEYKNGQYRHSATALLSVKAPPAPIEVLDVVKFYSAARNFGFIHCDGHGFTKGEAILRGSVAKKAGIVPGANMPVRAFVVQKPEGPEVVSFEWGSDVEAAYAAKLAKLHAEDVPDKPVKAKRATSKKAAAESVTPKIVAKKTATKKVAKVAKVPDDIVALVEANVVNGSGGAMAEAFAHATGK